MELLEVTVPKLPNLHGLHVLVVDDNEDIREILSAFLTHLGAVVTTVPNAREGLAALNELRAHVILSDISMPGIDGLEFIRHVRARPGEADQRTPAIAITGFALSEDRERALRSGYDAFIAKPVDPVFVAQEVARWTGRPRVVRQHRAS